MHLLLNSGKLQTDDLLLTLVIKHERGTSCSMPSALWSLVHLTVAARPTRTQAHNNLPLGHTTDPIHTTEPWLRRNDQQAYAPTTALPRAYETAYLPFVRADNHSRAVLLLADTADASDARATPLVNALADRVALACECVVLCPRPPASRWGHAALVEAFSAASTYLHRVHGVEALGIVALGRPADVALELLAADAIEAHAFVALQPTVSASVERALRDVACPTLCVPSGSADAAQRLQAGLSLNPRLGSEYYVHHLDSCSPDVFVRPASARDHEGAEDAASVATAWIDRFVPETDQRTAIEGRI